MSDHPPVEGQPSPGRRFPIGSLVASIVVIAVLIACGLGQFMGSRNTQAAQARFSSWINQVKKDNPSLNMRGMSVSSQSSWMGSSRRSQYRFGTPAGRTITIEADLHSGAIWGPGRVLFSTEGRSVTWPLADVDRGRTIDLKAEFPEAFR